VSVTLNIFRALTYPTLGYYT